MMQTLVDYLHTQQVDPAPVLQRLERVDLPLGRWLRQQCRVAESPLLIGLNGAQGTGKSTFASGFQLLLREAFSLESVVLSIDDYYFGQSQRQQLAEQIHPLFSTRGVPGTHDLQRLQHQIDQLMLAKSGDKLLLDRFDKSMDESTDQQVWHCPPSGLDLILLEGWCVGAVPQREVELVEPANQLEQNEDPEGVWRGYANRQLEGAYRQLFARLDRLLMLQAPAFSSVLEWRQLQEQKLRQSHPGKGMTEDEVARFVAHYERLTRHMLDTLPLKADVLMPIGENHQICSIHFHDEEKEIQ